jgi:hypothetical protein
MAIQKQQTRTIGSSQRRGKSAVLVGFRGTVLLAFLACGLLLCLTALHLKVNHIEVPAATNVTPVAKSRPANQQQQQQQRQQVATKPPPKLAEIATKKRVTIAYAISLVKCGDHQSTAAGLTDAAIVMRHSIHLSHQTSKYDYKMYAIVHRNAEACSHLLQDVGFEISIVDPPVQVSEIQGEFLRKSIHKEWCCGADEFIKLYAYELPQPVIVHVDIDFAFYKPMDDLFDAILYDKDSPEGKAARSVIPLERPEESYPDTIGAFITRDWPQVIPGRKAGYQAGFLVARRDPNIVKEVVEVIKEGNYVDGFGRDNGWGGAGYGGFVGAKAMQGLMAYYYDMIRPNNAVELNQCRFNHMGMDVKKGNKCRTNRTECEDCMTTDFEKIYNVHYTECNYNLIEGGHRVINIFGSHMRFCLFRSKALELYRARFQGREKGQSS